MTLSKLSLAALIGVTALGAQAQQVVNIYSARHYPSDEALYTGFTQATGIRINRVDSDDAGILARLKAEGSASAADVILLVDAARLWRGEVDGLFQPVRSKTLESAIPAPLRGKPDADGASSWFGFSTRARVVVYDRKRVQPSDVDSYEKLADSRNKGKVCVRSGSHPYNLSLFGAMLEHLGEAKTQNWLKGVVDNMARSPKGGDTDQIRAVGSGECAIALSNTYYVARLMRSESAEDKALMSQVGVMFPGQSSWGTHVNVAGGAIARHARHRDAAVRFLEYLASPAAQAHFADGNNEWPVARGVEIGNPALKSMSGGPFKADATPVSVIGMNQVKVQQLLDRTGFR